MRLKYDPSADAAYIYLTPPDIDPRSHHTVLIDPRELNGGQIVLDFDEEGRLLGIEVLDARRMLPKGALDASHEDL